MSDCIFCERQLNSEEKCVWCGFHQKVKGAIPGTLPFGTKLKDYVIGDVAEVDGESTTYYAFDKTIQQKVLVKEFLPVTMVAPRNTLDISVQPEKQVLFKNLLYDFVDLYQTLQKIKSPALPKIHEVFIENKTAYAVIDSVKGVPLRDVLIARGKTFTYKEIRWMLEPIFALMEEMSKLNIHHGGISDETVIITHDGNVVLTGFAIQDLRTKNDHVAYKLYKGFSAPEQYYSDRFQGTYTDIYALASLIYYSVTGKLLEKSALEGKEIYRTFPKCVLEALRYATKENQKERLDSISDFIMMLDDKGTVIKPKEEKSSKKDKKTVQYGIIGAVAVAVLAIGLSAVNKPEQPPASEVEPNTEVQQPEQLYVPNLIGQKYAEVIADSTYIDEFIFVKLDSYSDEYSAGKICLQSPASGQPVTAGTTIYLTVSLGPQAVKVPEIIGISFNDAVEKLDQLGIVYRKEYVDQTREYVHGMVADLSIDEGEEISVDQVLVVYVANDKPFATPTPKPTPTPEPTPKAETENETSQQDSRARFAFFG